MLVNKQRKFFHQWPQAYGKHPAKSIKPLCGSRYGLKLFPIPGQQFMEPTCRMIGDPAQYVGQPGFGINAVELCCDDEDSRSMPERIAALPEAAPMPDELEAISEGADDFREGRHITLKQLRHDLHRSSR